MDKFKSENGASVSEELALFNWRSAGYRSAQEESSKTNSEPLRPQYNHRMCGHTATLYFSQVKCMVHVVVVTNCCRHGPVWYPNETHTLDKYLCYKSQMVSTSCFRQ